MLMRFIDRAEVVIICILLLVTTLLVVVDVTLRFGFNSGFSWTQELTLHMSVWIFLFVASYGLRFGAHLGMGAFNKLLPVLGPRIVSGIAAVLALLYCWLVIYGSWVYLAKMEMIGIELQDIPIPAWQAHGMLVIGYLFLTIRLLVILCSLITGKAAAIRKDEARH